MSSRTYWLGNWSYRPNIPVPCISLLQIGLQMQCLWTGPLVGSKAIGSDPGLRIAFICFCTSAAQSLYMEAHELSLTAHHLKLALNYVLKQYSLLKYPAYSCIFKPENVKLYEESVSKIPPLGIRILTHLDKCKINLNLINDVSSWTFLLGCFQLLQSGLT